MNRGENITSLAEVKKKKMNAVKMRDAKINQDSSNYIMSVNHWRIIIFILRILY